MIEGPSGLRPRGPYPPSTRDEAWPVAFVSSAGTAALGVLITAGGIRLANGKMIFGGVSLTVEGTVSVATLLAGGTSNNVTQIREGFKYWPTKIHETAALKGVQKLAERFLSAEDARQLAVSMDAANKARKAVKGGDDEGVEAVAGLIKAVSSEAIKSKAASDQAQGRTRIELEAGAERAPDSERGVDADGLSVGEREGSAGRTGTPDKRPGSSPFLIPNY